MTGFSKETLQKTPWPANQSISSLVMWTKSIRNIVRNLWLYFHLTYFTTLILNSSQSFRFLSFYSTVIYSSSLPYKLYEQIFFWIKHFSHIIFTTVSTITVYIVLIFNYFWTIFQYKFLFIFSCLLLLQSNLFITI